MAARMISDMRARGLIQPDTDGLLLNDALIEFAGTGSSR
jgi:hypothetical protein